MPGAEIWRRRLLTARAALLLCLARILIGLVPLRYWRSRLGRGGEEVPHDSALWAKHAARHVERAARRLPFQAKCLPQAMALSWLMRSRKIAHRVSIAVRPADMREEEDALHAWVEMNGIKIIGDLPGPWHVIFRAPVHVAG